MLGHGFGVDQTSWEWQVSALLSAGFRIVTFDFPGASGHCYGDFDRHRHASLYGFAEDVIRVVTDAKAAGATYIGHSLGGMAGLLASNAEPGLFNALFLIGASPRYIDDAHTDYQGGFTAEQIDQLLSQIDRDYIAWANGFGPIVADEASNPLFSNQFTERLTQLRPDVARMTLAAAFKSDHRPDVVNVKVPVKVTQSKADPAVPLMVGNWMVEHTRSEALEIIATKGHFPYITAPDQVSNSILSFLERVNADG